MADVECPYCGYEQDINHDDGYGYDESQTFEQECHECEKIFTFTTYIHFSYDVKAAPYLNESNEEFADISDVNIDGFNCEDEDY